MMRGPARNRFTIGQRVRLSEYGREHFAREAARQRSWIVVGFGRRPDLLRLRAEGLKEPQSYHQDFWEPIDPSRHLDPDAPDSEP